MTINGIELITPSSINFAGTSATINAGGSVTFTAVTSLSLNGVFSSAYDNYIIDMRHVASSASAAIQLRWRTGTDNSTANSYVRQQLDASSTTVFGLRSTENVTRITITESARRDGTQIFVYGPNLVQPTAYRSVTVWADGGAAITDFAGTHNQSVAYTGFTLFPASGSFTGLIKVYGLVQ